MSRTSDNALLVFAKAPVEGEVKTRLEPLLGRGGALGLHRAFLDDAIDRMMRMRSYADPYLYVAAHAIDGYPVPTRSQRGGDLGERLATAFAELFEDGYLRIAAMGIDSPTMPDSLVRDCFQLLQTRNLVLGPCDDGGYYLIGLKAPQPELFQGISWGSDEVLAQTLSRARDLGMSIALLPTLFDVDRPDDLRRLERALLLAPPGERPTHVQSFLQAKTR